MGDLRDPQVAREFLMENGYQLTQGCDVDVTHITYRDGTGNGLWEGDKDILGAASENGWIRKERDKCCLFYEKERRDANYCGKCGNGVNGNVTWLRMNDGDFFDSLFVEAGFSLEETRNKA